MSKDNAQKPVTRSRAIWLIGIILLLAAALVSGWYWIASLVDGRVTELRAEIAASGRLLKCDGQEVRGFPFRVGVFCDRLAYADPVNSITASGGAVRSAAQLYRPNHIVAEMDSPLDITMPGLAPLTLDWSSFRSSSQISDSGPGQLSLVFSQLKVAANDAGVRNRLASIDEIQLHARDHPDADAPGMLDLAVSADDWKVGPEENSEIEPIELQLDIGVEELATAIRQGRDFVEMLRESGGAGIVRNLSLATQSGGRVQINGPLEIASDGRLSGELSIDLDDPQLLVAYAAEVFPPAAAAFGDMVGYLSALSGRDGEKVTIRDFKVLIRRGNVYAGFFKIAEIPPLF